MPAVAIAGAVAAVGVAASTGFAIAATVAAVGATVGAIGVITKSKELTIAGSIVGAIGAVGGLASSAGLFGAGGLDGLFSGASAVGEGAAAQAAGLAGDVSFIAPAGGDMASVMAGSDLPGVFTGVDAAGLPGFTQAAKFETIDDVINAMTGEFVGVDTPASPSAFQSTGSGWTAADGMGDAVLPDAATNAAVPTLENAVAAPGSAPPPAPGEFGATHGVDPTAGVGLQNRAMPGGLIDTPPVTGTAAPNPGQAATGTPFGPDLKPPALSLDAGVPGFGQKAIAAAKSVGPVPVGDRSVWGDIYGLLDKRATGTIVSGVVQAGAAFFGGAMSELTPAQIRALEAQAAQNQAQANLITQQAAILQRQNENMRGGIPVAISKTPKMPLGLINTPSLASPITGRPA